MDYEKLAKDFIMNKIPRGHEHAHANIEKFQNFTKGERFALFCLLNGRADADGRMSPSDIATGTQTTTARTSAILNKLEERGYVLREADPDDRRRIWVKVTEKGREIITREQDEVVKNTARIFRRMGEGDAKEFVRLFEMFFSYMAEDCKADCMDRRKN